MDFISLSAAAYLIESTVQAIKLVWTRADGVNGWLIVAYVLGIGVSYVFGLDILPLAGLDASTAISTGAAVFASSFFTGVAIGRGAELAHDLIAYLTSLRPL